MREWLGRPGVTTLFIEPGSPWEYGYVESLNGMLRDELLNGEIFFTLKEAQVLVANRRRLWHQHRKWTDEWGPVSGRWYYAVIAYALVMSGVYWWRLT